MGAEQKGTDFADDILEVLSRKKHVIFQAAGFR